MCRTFLYWFLWFVLFETLDDNGDIKGTGNSLEIEINKERTNKIKYLNWNKSQEITITREQWASRKVHWDHTTW